MTHAPPHTDAAVAAPRLSPIERLRGALLWLIGLSGAFVFIEPSPYEFVVAARHRRCSRSPA